MSLLSWYAKRKADRFGHEAETRFPAFDAYMKAHKTVTGSIFMSLGGWVYVYGCAPVVGQDFIKILHMTCGQLELLLLVAGAFLTGGGYLSADEFRRAQLREKAIESGEAVVVEPEKALVLPKPASGVTAVVVEVPEAPLNPLTNRRDN